RSEIRFGSRRGKDAPDPADSQRPGRGSCRGPESRACARASRQATLDQGTVFCGAADLLSRLHLWWSRRADRAPPDLAASIRIAGGRHVVLADCSGFPCTTPDARDLLAGDAPGQSVLPPGFLHPKHPFHLLFLPSPWPRRSLASSGLDGAPRSLGTLSRRQGRACLCEPDPSSRRHRGRALNLSSRPPANTVLANPGSRRLLATCAAIVTGER